jgi:hypothetical protein
MAFGSGMMVVLVMGFHTDIPMRVARCEPVAMLARPRLRASDIKRQLEAAGISTKGIVEKEELLKLLEGVEAEGVVGAISLPITYQQGGAYAEIDDPRCTMPLRLLCDTGAAVSIVSGAAIAAFGTSSSCCTLGSTSSPRLHLDVAIASPKQKFPPGVDGILGVDNMRTFGAAEFDWGASVLRLHARGSAADGIVAAWEGDFGKGTVVQIPLEMRRVSAGELPFVRTTFGEAVEGGMRCQVNGLIDTGCARLLE